METRAPYAVIGFFILAAVLSVFGFVYWLNHSGGIGERAEYRIRFQDNVAGMLTGAAVLFNGIRVGEVTKLSLNNDDPQEIIATISVAPETPVRADTTAGIEFQGLTGVAGVSLSGKSRTAQRLVSSDGQPPMIVADPMAGLSMTQSARIVLRRLDSLLADNAEPLQGSLANINKFTEALARNSDRIDGIVSGLERMTGGGAAATPPATYSLTAPQAFPAATRKDRQLVIPEPTALLVLDTQRILTLPSAPDTMASVRAQWADNIPKLVQAKLLETFENAGYFSAVTRPLGENGAQDRLQLELRHFEISAAGDPVAKVEIAAMLLNADGKVVATRRFQASAPVQQDGVAGAVAALDRAFGEAAKELVVWTAGAM